MKNLTLAAIAAACNGTYHGEEALLTKEVSSIVIDSRKVEKDSLFIAIKGARVDGHDFIPSVMKKGALCALSEMELGDVDYSYIVVEDCKVALKAIAEFYRRSLDIKVVGISGSVGKTSTKEMIASVLSQKYNVLKTAGNFNNEIGLPLTIFNIREEHEVAVLEMGISGFGEMTRLAKMARPDICVITNIGCVHLENLKDRDGVLKAKTEMMQYMNPQGTIIFNGNDDKLYSYVPENGVQPVYFGSEAAFDYHAKDIDNQGLHGTTATFITPESTFSAHISIPGEHMVHNAMAGIAVGRALGLTDDEIIAGIEALKPVAGRNHLIETANFTIIDDCYNANPISMKASLDVLSKANTRTVAILGDMFELGDLEKPMHYDVGKHAAEVGIQVLITIGSMAEDIAHGADDQHKEHPMKIYYFTTKNEFFGAMDHVLKAHDTILVKASHGMEFAEIVEVLEKK
ncbi:MAG: UDP-N-acetylmuramoyl-tripeptide--D-alanyl-D-alanine ligase [Ruminococcus sp.]|nr:UDP-N-acetylmuramoyl-tripeptide--D-alanyl-D-alanine ligase [Ruminococcus sp.]